MCEIHKDSPRKYRDERRSDDIQKRAKDRRQQTTDQGKMSLEEAEDRTGKRKKVKAESSTQICFNSKEIDAVCTEANKALANHLLNGRLKHLRKT